MTGRRRSPPSRSPPLGLMTAYSVAHVENDPLETKLTSLPGRVSLSDDAGTALRDSQDKQGRRAVRMLLFSDRKAPVRLLCRTKMHKVTIKWGEVAWGRHSV